MAAMIPRSNRGDHRQFEQGYPWIIEPRGGRECYGVATNEMIASARHGLGSL
jgi:hypothetical protein